MKGLSLYFYFVRWKFAKEMNTSFIAHRSTSDLGKVKFSNFLSTERRLLESSLIWNQLHLAKVSRSCFSFQTWPIVAVPVSALHTRLPFPQFLKLKRLECVKLVLFIYADINKEYQPYFYLPFSKLSISIIRNEKDPWCSIIVTCACMCHQNRENAF